MQNPRLQLRLSVCLLLGGQILYIIVTLFHAGGDANNHHAIFETYARDQIWMAVHLGQFIAMSLLVIGLLVLFTALDGRLGRATSLGRAGAAAAIVALALYGALQAVDGVALKQAVNAWASAPEAERGARFASAEAIRWIEWGMRSYHDFALGVALAIGAAAMARAVAWPFGVLVAASALAYFAQGWVAGSEGFSQAQSLGIVLGWAFSLVWMTALLVVAFRSTPAQGA